MRGVARTDDRSGVLIFVSLAERYARIIADDGIAGRVPQREWQGAVDALIAHMREGRVDDGFIVAAIEQSADKLAAHFPRTAADRSELLRPDLYDSEPVAQVRGVIQIHKSDMNFLF